MTARWISGAILALVGAVGVTASAYLDWAADRTPQDMPLDRLFQTSVSEPPSSYWTSVAVPLAIVTVLGVLGLILRSRVMLTVAWLVGLATLVLWVVMNLADDSVDFAIGDLGTGFWVCLAGLAVMLVGIASMGSRDAGATTDESLTMMERETIQSPDETL